MQGTANQGAWIPAILPYAKLIFGFSTNNCLALVQDKDVRCEYPTSSIYKIVGISDKVVCRPISQEYEKDFQWLEKKLTELDENKWKIEQELRELETKKIGKKEKEELKKELEKKLTELDTYFSHYKTNFIFLLERGRKMAERRVYDKLFDLIVAPYLAVANISDDEKQKVKVAWNSAVELLQSLPTSIPISIPQGFLVLRLAPTYIYSFVVELYTRFNTELLSSYYSSLGNYFSKFDRSFLAGCITMTGGVVPFNEAMQAMLQDLIISVAPRRDP